MEKYNYLIIGGGIAGVTAAETIRQKDAVGSIAIVTNEPYKLYSRVMLSKPDFFLGKIPFDRVWMKSDEWYGVNKITFLNHKIATAIDAAGKSVSFADETKLAYEKLLLATGACARRWNVPGADKKGIYYLRSLDDGKAIMGAIKTAKHALIIGGGFIGFEMADLLRMANINTTFVLLESYFWEPVLDEDAGRMVEKALLAGGVKIMHKAEVAEVLGSGSVEGVVLKDGTKLECDMVVCGIGTACTTDWLRASGLQANQGIIVDERLRTNLPDVWAAGDVSEYKDIVLDETIHMGNWMNAREQGKVAGLNMAGTETPFNLASFYTAQGLGISIVFVGDVRASAGRGVVKRGSPAANSYGRIIVLDKGGRKELEGAVLINRSSELMAIAKIIEKNIDVSQKLRELGDEKFDLKTFL